jgi:polysaccharide deacetylase 2 family uncharacterized protein YibQ
MSPRLNLTSCRGSHPEQPSKKEAMLMDRVSMILRVAGLSVGALLVGALLGIGIAILTGPQGKGGNVEVPYPASREASSEYEPAKRAGWRPPRVVIEPSADVVPPMIIKGAGDALRETGPLGKPTREGEIALLTPDAAPGTATKAPARAPLPAWRRFAARVSLVPEKPMIAVVIDDLGLDTMRTARTIGLPSPLTLAFLPYGNRLPAESKAARTAGHELLIHMPMEPQGPTTADPGPQALMVELGPDEIRNRLDRALGRFSGYVGINNHMGSRFTADAAAMDVVLAELGRRGLLFLDSRTTDRTVADARAYAAGVAFARRHVFLDAELTGDGVAARLGDLETVARKAGYAIAIGHPHDVTLDALEKWLPAARAKGFQLVPVSAIVARLATPPPTTAAAQP